MKKSIHVLSLISKEVPCLSEAMFSLAKNKQVQTQECFKIHKRSGFPYISAIVLALIVLLSFASPLFIPYDPNYIHPSAYNQAPNAKFIFGSDILGRDMFSMLFSGARLSLIIGVLAAFISSLIAVIIGALQASIKPFFANIISRFSDILLSIPSLLLLIFLQSVLGLSGVFGIALAIGLSSWMSMSKLVATEIMQIKNSEYILASKLLGAGFSHILFKHLLKSLMGGIMFMSVMLIRLAIIAEASLSFMGLGLPVEIISLGSLLSMSQRALLSGSWWIILLPGLMLVAIIMSITLISNYIRGQMLHKHSNL